METYGEYLKALRESKGLTLRDVEKQTDVSNAYLSQLESGRIKQPSPTMLYKLSELYGIEYNILLEKVGYPIQKPLSGNKLKVTENQVFSRIGKISHEEELELLEYLKFIRSRRK